MAWEIFAYVSPWIFVRKTGFISQITESWIIICGQSLKAQWLSIQAKLQPTVHILSSWELIKPFSFRMRKKLPIGQKNRNKKQVYLYIVMANRFTGSRTIDWDWIPHCRVWIQSDLCDWKPVLKKSAASLIRVRSTQKIGHLSQKLDCNRLV